MSVTLRSRTTRNHGRRAGLLPDQHGAWAFLGLPFALGMVLGSWSPYLVPLGLAWTAAYAWSWAASGMLGHPRVRDRYYPAFVLWQFVLAAAASVLLAGHPWLIWAALLYGPLVAVNLWHARRRSERSLVNDLVLVAECGAMVPVVVAVGGGGWEAVFDARVAALTAVCLLLLTGSTLHVRSLIRERANPRFADLARGYALACVPASVLLAVVWGDGGAWLVAPFVVLVVRAYAVPRSWRPARIGLVELAMFLLTTGAAVLAAVSPG